MSKTTEFYHKKRVLDTLDGLTAANAVQLVLDPFLKIDHYCGGFKPKLRRVGLILTKLSFDKDF